MLIKPFIYQTEYNFPPEPGSLYFRSHILQEYLPVYKSEINLSHLRHLPPFCRSYLFHLEYYEFHLHYIFWIYYLPLISSDTTLVQIIFSLDLSHWNKFFNWHSWVQVQCSPIQLTVLPDTASISAPCPKTI